MEALLTSSLFGALTRNVQARIDAASELNKRLFDNVIYRNYLDWDTPTIGLDFEELIGKYNITIAAPTIGDGSKEPILQTEGLQTIKETVVNHALTLPLSMKDYRKILALLDSKSISDKARETELIKIMWGNVQTVVNGVEAKLDMIFLGALSNCGTFTFDNNNNPEGGVKGSITYDMPVIQVNTIEQLIEAEKWARTSNEARQFQTICVDSISEIAEVVLAKAKKDSKDPRQAYGVLLDKIIMVIKAFRDLPGKHVLMLAKEEQIKVIKTLYL